MLITTIEELRARAPDWMGKSFSYDVETTGLDPRKDRLVGLSFYFESETNVYIALEHTDDEQPWRITKEGLKQGVFPHGPDYTEYDTFGYWERNTNVYITTEQLVEVVQPIFDQTDVWQVAHNAKFDVRFMRAAGLFIRGKLHDTMLAGKIIDENFDVYGLKQMALRDLGMTMDNYQSLTHYLGYGKDEFLAVPLNEAAEYALLDTEATWKLFLKQQPLLKREEVEEPFYEIWMPLLLVLSEMEDRGIATDVEAIKAYREESLAKTAELEVEVWKAGIDMVLSWFPDIPPQFQKIARQVDPEFVDEGQNLWEYNGIPLPILREEGTRKLPRLPVFNVGSTQQLAYLLYDHLGLRPPKGIRLNKTNNGRSVDRDTLEVLKISYGDDAPRELDLLLQWRKLSKLLTAFLGPMLEMVDPEDHNCIRATFNQHIADTGRLSCNSPNLQQVPSRGPIGQKMRSFFVARPGHKLIVADFSNQEPRILGHYAKDENYIQAFSEGWDLHSLTASKLFNISYDEFIKEYKNGNPEFKRMRDVGKVTNLSGAYGIGPGKFKTRLYVDGGIDVTLNESREYLENAAAGFPATTKWKESVPVWGRKLGFVRTLAGRKRRHVGLYAHDKWERMAAERIVTNFVIQGSASDVTAVSMIAAQEQLKQVGAYLLLQVHDELVAEAPEENAEAAAAVLQYCMTVVPNERFNLRIPMKAEPAIVDNWRDGK